MKRSPLKRTSALKADPAKTAAFVQRGRGGLARTRNTMSRAAPTPPLPGARGWTQRVFALYGDRCVVCGGRATQAHHAVARQTILAARHLSPQERAALAYCEVQGVPICTAHHAAHELAAQRIPFERLPIQVVTWAIEHGFRSRIMDGRVYPRTGL